jgi:hypothetical protein
MKGDQDHAVKSLLTYPVVQAKIAPVVPPQGGKFAIKQVTNPCLKTLPAG